MTYLHCCPWLPQPHLLSERGGALPLLCFPYAGGRWTAYRDWADELPTSIHVVPLDYPRMQSDRPAFSTVAELAHSAHSALGCFWDEPVVLFGHSLGALVAFELALLLAAEGGPPVHLFVSGHRAPGHSMLEPPAHDLPWPELFDRLRRWGGVPQDLLADRELMGWFEPILRAELRIAEIYRPVMQRAPLAGKVVALAGLHDNTAPPASMNDWGKVTRGPFALHSIPGGHFFLNGQRQHLLSLIASELDGTRW